MQLNIKNHHIENQCLYHFFQLSTLLLLLLLLAMKVPWKQRNPKKIIISKRVFLVVLTSLMMNSQLKSQIKKVSIIWILLTVNLSSFSTEVALWRVHLSQKQFKLSHCFFRVSLMAATSMSLDLGQDSKISSRNLFCTTKTP